MGKLNTAAQHPHQVIDDCGLSHNEQEYAQNTGKDIQRVSSFREKEHLPEIFTVKNRLQG